MSGSSIVKDKKIELLSHFIVLLLLLSLPIKSFSAEAQTRRGGVGNGDTSEKSLTKGATFRYNNSLKPIKNPQQILAGNERFVEPITGGARFESAPVVIDSAPTLQVRAWRYSYNARGIIEFSNYLDGSATALVVVHPWGIDDGQGLRTTEPAGAVFYCTPEKNSIYVDHTREVLAPFITKMRNKVKLIMYSLSGSRDSIRTKLYSSIDHTVTSKEQQMGGTLLAKSLDSFDYRGANLPTSLTLSKSSALRDYFASFPAVDNNRYNGRGFWLLPVPLAITIPYSKDDIVYYDDDGYAALKNYLKKKGIKHILLCGYATDGCVKSTTAGYVNLKKDFDVFLVGDATMATFPAQETPAGATTKVLSDLSLDNPITEISWLSDL